LPDLPKLPPDPSKQDKIEDVKMTVVDRSARTLAETYIDLRREKNRIQKELSDINVRVEAYEQLLEDSKETGLGGWGQYGVKDNALRLSTGDTIRVQKEPYGQVVDKEAFRQWCIANGYERQLQLWPSTMSSIVKERLISGEPEPDGCETYAKTTIVYVPKGEK
jgi:hypothetical protein